MLDQNRFSAKNPVPNHLQSVVSSITCYKTENKERKPVVLFPDFQKISRIPDVTSIAVRVTYVTSLFLMSCPKPDWLKQVDLAGSWLALWALRHKNDISSHFNDVKLAWPPFCTEMAPFDIPAIQTALQSPLNTEAAQASKNISIY